MTTARDLIKAQYRKLGVLGVGSSLQDEEAQDALQALNAMIASWSTQGALIYTETKETFPLTGAVSYTIGSGQDFDTTVPKAITSAYVTDVYDYALRIIDSGEYNDIADKDFVDTPCKLYFDGNYPTATIYTYPVKSGVTLTMFSQKALTGFATLDTEFTMPPEYERALIYNLAIEMAPEFEQEPSMTVKRIAKQSLEHIKRQNKKNNNSRVRYDGIGASRGTYDIRSGDYR